ncbi:MAG: 2-oxoglutarate dehydrogenase E1 component [Rhodospirillaceae bacterium]|nr:2-oxoglutarate dehydrogenase E1 component [Rhodospirillaceae bacterium]
MGQRIEELSFLYGTNANYIEELYARYKMDPEMVDEAWREVFEDLGDDEASINGELEPSRAARRIQDLDNEPEGYGFPPNGGNGHAQQAYGGSGGGAAPAQAPMWAPAPGSRESVAEFALARDSIRILMMIRAYRVRGHLAANLDPLGIEGGRHHPELDPKTYGFTEEDYGREFFVDGVLGFQRATLQQILDAARKTYCGSIGVEFMHIQSPAEKYWIQRKFEGTRSDAELGPEEKKRVLSEIFRSEGFERFLSIKYPGSKRFSLEGAEGTIAAMETIIRTAARQGIEEIVLGMPHRGRLNILTNVMGKSYAQVFSEFQGESSTPDAVQGSGDVKYHLGTSSDRQVADGRSIHLSLTANPSHLEAVNPVVEGKVRAKQTMIEDNERRRIMGILLHGDAAFAGQGLVAETLGMSELRGYRTGGTIHIIVNNQIGFTTSPRFSRSSPYPSDVAKMVSAPIFHVNGDDPEAVVHVSKLAAKFRQEFGRDVVIDIFCYRRHGHNEGDEPAFTQPIMYRTIAKHPTTRQLYTERLVAEGVITPVEADRMIQDFNARLEKDLEASQGYKPNKVDWLEGVWSGLEVSDRSGARRGMTAVPMEELKTVGAAISSYPETLNIHRKLKRILDQRKEMVESGQGIDWATAEALAFGTLLHERANVRLSGQDCGRGTFSQRHSVLVDQLNEDRYIPLNHISDDQGRYEVIDSMLSEAGILGFEYGYSLADPNTLVLWEAQFGDFANGAQVIVDQFLTAGESKWFRMSGLVMLLPHGFEGQGPEHSSGRPERYLQLAAEDNLQIANCTSPSSYFHLLRRQMKRKFRKPLIVMTPKSLLRHKRCISAAEEFTGDTQFHRSLWELDDASHGKDMKRVVLCTGKVYYDLLEKRDELGLKDVTFIRLEQIAPFPLDALQEAVNYYPKAKFVWCQEEPRNMGAWNFVRDKIDQALEAGELKMKQLQYVGRPEAASPATGFIRVHEREQDALVTEALTG